MGLHLIHHHFHRLFSHSLCPEVDPEPDLDPAVYFYEPSSPVAQVAPHVPNFDPSGFAYNPPTYIPYASPLGPMEYSTTNGFTHHDKNLAIASDADMDGSADAEGEDNGDVVADDEEEDPVEDDLAPFYY